MLTLTRLLFLFDMSLSPTPVRHDADRNSVAPDPDALSEDEDVVKRRELLELEEAVMQLKARQGRRA